MLEGKATKWTTDSHTRTPLSLLSLMLNVCVCSINVSKLMLLFTVLVR